MKKAAVRLYGTLLMLPLLLLAHPLFAQEGSNSSSSTSTRLSRYLTLNLLLTFLWVGVKSYGDRNSLHMGDPRFICLLTMLGAFLAAVDCSYQRAPTR